MHYQSLTLKPSPPRETPIGLLASRVAHSVRQLVAAHAEPLGITIQQFWAIVAVEEDAVNSQVELASRLRVDEATACRAVRALGDAGLVVSLRDLSDRRRVRLELTPSGEALAQRLLPVAQRIRAAIDSALTAEERATTRAALTKLVARLGALREEGPQGRLSPLRPPASVSSRRPPLSSSAPPRARPRRSPNGKE